jgi:hypothetical protein
MRAKLLARIAPLVFLIYVFIGFIAIPRWNEGRDFSLFAAWNLFADFKPRGIWYDLRMTGSGDASYFSKDFATERLRGQQLAWRLWGQLQNMRLSGADEPNAELKALIEQVNSQFGSTKVEIVRWRGSLMPHLQGNPATDIETVWTAP